MKYLIAIILLLATLFGVAIVHRSPPAPAVPQAIVETVPLPRARPAPVAERVRVKVQKKRLAVPVRERKLKVPRNPGGDKLPVSCATIKWYHEHLPQSVLDQMEKKFKPTPGQRAAAAACLKEV